MEVLGSGGEKNSFPLTKDKLDTRGNSWGIFKKRKTILVAAFKRLPTIRREERSPQLWLCRKKF